MRKLIVLPFFIIISTWIFGCSSFSISEAVEEAPVVQQQDKIFIVDRDGKKWDVTHAVTKYGFVASQFQFGLGKNAIVPIQGPEMIAPGEPGYPSLTQSFLVIGTNLNNDARAYPIFVLKSHEVVDEQFGDLKVAVAY